MLYGALRQLLFHIDAERVHEMAIRALALAEYLPVGAPKTVSGLQQDVWGIHFANPLGLAAGFDKNAHLPHVWSRFGFGFAELGTVTALPQPGNPKPRIFRVPEAGALINRLGFNNDGAEAVAARLTVQLQLRTEAKTPTPATPEETRSTVAVAKRRPASIPLGINIGKSAVTPIEDAAADYRRSYQLLAPLADYVTINVSSPNTRDLRTLQAAAALEKIVDTLHSATPTRGAVPLLVKIAPDLDNGELEEVVRVVIDKRVDGIIATNTTISRETLPAGAAHATETGGLSGRPLERRSTDIIRTLYRLTEGALPIVGVGGIFDADDAFAKITAGASLLQMYTGFVYGGPATPARILDGLVRRLDRAGFSTLRQAVGQRSG